MLLSEPPRTQYDINFSIFGFPVRVHPAFFVMPLLLGAGFLSDPRMNAGVTLIVLIVVFFLSILVHELGHALAFRYFGQHSRVVLYWMGGLAIPDSGLGGSWGPRSNVSLTPNQQIIVSLAGPFAGFLFAGLLIGMVIVSGGAMQFSWSRLMPDIFPDLRNSYFGGSDAMNLFVFVSIWANIFINLMNLAPVYPLDGGQVARQLFIQSDTWNGVKYSIVLSIVVAALIALVSFAQGDRFLGFFFGFMAWSNYMAFQQMGGGFGGGGGGRPW